MVLEAGNAPKTGPKRAHVDRTGIEIVRVEKTAIPKPTPEIVAMAAKIHPPQKTRQKPCTHGPSYMDRLHDETCSSCQPPSSAQELIPIEWHHMPWDEVEMKKHSLMDKRCHHVIEVPLADEVEMKKQGLVDSEGHLFPRLLDEKERQKAIEAAARCHEKLEMIARQNKGALALKQQEPHVKVSHDVQVCDGEGEEDQDEEEEEAPSSSTTLTARGSASERLSVSSEESRKYGPTTRVSPSKATRAVEKRERGAEPATWETTGAGPVVMSKAYESEDGQFELSFTIQVLVKPKATTVRQGS